MNTRRSICFLICATALVGGKAMAQPFPHHPITLVIPLAPGDSGDIAARAIGKELGTVLGVPIVPVNRPGAGGAIATEQVIRAQRDGYSILYTQNSPLTVRPVTEPAATTYDVLRDLTPLALASRSPMILAVRSDSSYRDFAALIDAGRRPQADLRVATPGVGSVADFSVAAIGTMTKAALTSVPFKGASPALNATSCASAFGVNRPR